MKKLLFICSRNQWRSPTAEMIYRNIEGVSARSAGTSTSARRKISEGDISWADKIFVMENKHKKRLMQRFGKSLKHEKLHVLDIPDDYQYMDSELIELLRVTIDWYLDVL